MVETKSVKEHIDSLDQGDLLLIRTKNSIRKSGSPVLGIYEDFSNFSTKKKFKFFDPVFKLKEQSDLSGAKDKFLVGHLGQNIYSISHIGECYSGVDDIVKYLSGEERFAHHCSWIRDLTEPFVLPDMKIFQYYYLDVEVK